VTVRTPYSRRPGLGVGWLLAGILISIAAVCSSAAAQSPLSAEQERALKPKDSFKQCTVCPEMVMVPAGTFSMGSPKNEKGRDDNESPQHKVTIAGAFAAGKFEVTVDQFAAFAEETKYDMGSVCDVWQDGKWSDQPGRSWRDPGFPQTGSHPVACVSWDDAKAYLEWLSRKAGKTFRLPTEAEWEYLARAGAAARFHFGANDKDYCRYGNGADQSARSAVPGAKAWKVLACSDGQPYTAPVGSFAANAFGLHDTHGNVFEWTEDCWHGNYSGAPADGSAWVTGKCETRVLRGGAWGYPPDYLRTAVRGQIAAAHRYVNAGLRVVRSIAP
jgi:formylglycine-generating enzyme required for sulfatase activity